MNNERNPIVNVWGAYFLLFLLMEYLFELGPKTVYVYAVLIGILALSVLSRLFKKVFVKTDYIVAWTILTLLSILVPFGFDYIGINSSCTDKLCIMNSRFYVMIFFNLAISALMIVINILVLPIRIITKKR